MNSNPEADAPSVPLKAIDRYAFSVFADDIRQDNSGKFMFWGVYIDELLVPKLPVLLPRLAIWTTILTPWSRPFGRMVLRIYKDDQVVASSEVDDAALAEGAIARQGREIGVDAHETAQIARVAVTLSPVLIEKEGWIRIRIETESEVLRGGALRLGLMPPHEGNPAE